tara:strand:- start:191 stop:295 length:105 start_codon:yes stop_codon:yes gene_type:complete
MLPELPSEAAAYLGPAAPLLLLLPLFLAASGGGF